MMSYTFNPLEIAFCGDSNSGKTTLITKLIKEFSTDYNVGYVKHSGCGFTLDKPGKDSCKARESGASTVHIHDNNHSATLHYPPKREHMVENDIVFIEGYKDSPIPKIVFTNNTEKNKKEYTNVIARISLTKLPSNKEKQEHEPPTFHRDDIPSIKKHIEKYLNTKPPLYGLVLVGGKSKRMGTEKALLTIHKETQVTKCHALLSQFCKEVFVSCREDQHATYNAFSTIKDKFIGFGPLGGILSAMNTRPHAAWIVLACDMPHTTTETIQQLIINRKHQLFGTFFKTQKGVEPLCAVYEPKCVTPLLISIANQEYSLQKTLSTLRTNIIEPTKEEWFTNINTPEDLRNEKKQ